MKIANYRIVSESLESIVIEDCGPWDQFPTVTNSAEEVIDDLRQKGYLKTNQRLFYYDSDGIMDELLLKNFRFNGFAPGPKIKEAEPHV